MAIYSISDLHLGLSNNKPMDIFGPRWANYLEILKENWQNTIKPEDLVLIPGDTSWAMYISEAEEDFAFLDALNGIKLISKGNHDYWWETLNKLNGYTEKMGFSTIRFLHNSVYRHEQIAICAAKGYPNNGTGAEEQKLYQREVSRLRLSLDMAKATGARTIYAMLHYPPAPESDFVKLLEEYGVSLCLYGHLHGRRHQTAFEGLRGGVEYRLVSADYLEFKPRLLYK
ncbi:MAG: serine/threonine protein phosphatase [Ruminococcaceae bacterium]|nr:serine/threonine protein phosphatase [Oscillospiraceae bacterium]